MLKIRPGLVLAYTLLEPHPSRTDIHQGNAQTYIPPKGVYEGILSPSAKKKLVNAVNLLVAIALPKKAIHFDSKKEFTFRVNFITLTLPSAQGNVQDKELKQVALKQWLEYWKDKLPGMSYVWRAERQGNGNLHFHILTDRYIHYKDIRDTWNKRLSKYHFIDEFEKANGHRYPNSTDVHGVKKVRNLGAYIAKYMSKKEEHPTPIDGKVWDCSKNLKAKDSCTFMASGQDLDEFGTIYDALPKDRFDTDHCSGIRMTESLMHKHLRKEWKQLYSAYLARIRSQ